MLGSVLVASGAGGVSDGVAPGSGDMGSGGMVDGAVSAGAGGVVIVASSFFAQPAANNIVETATKTKARMICSSNYSDGIGFPY